MATLDHIQEMWKTDCVIDEDNLDKESVRSASLHQKYLDHYVENKLKLAKLNSDMANLRRTKAKYYRGEMTKEELQHYGWDQWLYNKPLKSEMDEVLDGDVDVCNLRIKVEYIASIMFYLESVLQQIKSRDWQIKNCLEYKKFIVGM
jgi:hypothetical protein